MERWTLMDEALDFAIGEEQDAIDFYIRLARETRVPGMKEVLEDFAKEEMAHKAKLEAIQAGETLSPPEQDVIDLKIADYVADVSADPQVNYRDALVLAMKKEKAAFKLYTALAVRAHDERLKTTFKMLAQEEARHKLRFEIEYDDLLKEN